MKQKKKQLRHGIKDYEIANWFQYRKGILKMNNRPIKEAIHMIRIMSSYMTDEAIDIIKLFTCNLYGVEVRELNQMIKDY